MHKHWIDTHVLRTRLLLAQGYIWYSYGEQNEKCRWIWIVLPLSI